MNKESKKLSSDVEARCWINKGRYHSYWIKAQQAHHSHTEIEELLEMEINIDFSFSITVINIQASHTYDAEVSLCTWQRNLLLEVKKSIKQFSNNF